MNTVKEEETYKFCGKPLKIDDLALIKEIVGGFGLARKEMAATVCELLDWTRPNGKLKTIECTRLLEKLNEAGVVHLPERKKTGGKGVRRVAKRTEAGNPEELIDGTVGDITPVILERVERKEARELWKELIDRYHYLGFKMPIGAQLWYLVKTGGNASKILGCLQFTSPAWKLKARDAWIGWDSETRESNLQQIVQNSRFLLLPWVKVKGLASHVLGLSARQLGKDWERHYGIRPVLLESFVDKERFAGTCYKAANWLNLGDTQGRGRMDREHLQAIPVKSIWVYPLHRRFREKLGVSRLMTTQPSRDE